MELQARNGPVESAEASWTPYRHGSNERSAPPGASSALPARGVRGASQHAPRSRGHRPAWGELTPARATLETLHGTRQADRGVIHRCPRVPGPAGLGTQGHPEGSGDPAPRNSLQDGRGLWSRVGTRPWHSRCGDLGCPSGEARGLVVFGANRRISLGNGSSESLPRQASLALDHSLPAPFMPAGTVEAGEAHRGQDRTGPQGRRPPPAPASAVSPGGDLQNRCLPSNSEIIRCKLLHPWPGPLILTPSCGHGDSSEIRLARTERSHSGRSPSSSVTLGK